jgi:ribonuclease P protein component
MLSQKYRFHSRGGVRHTYKDGKSIRSPKISIIYTPNTHKKQRFAVVVSKKVLKSAVGRNRIRRRVYEALRLEFPAIKIPVDCIFIIYTKEIQDIPFQALQGEIKELLLSAKIC